MEIINDVNGLFEFQDLGARTELKNKANLVQSKNLFDMTSYLNFLNALATRPIVNGTLDNIDSSSFTFTTTGYDCYTNGWAASSNTVFKVPVEKNTTYTMSWNFSGSDGLTFVFFNGVSGSGNMVQTKNSKKTLTFTTKEDTTFITVRFGITDGGTSATIGNIQIELGKIATDYMPYRVATGVKELDEKMSMLMSSLKRIATGTNIVNITNTAENGILKVTANSGVTCKNKNIFEDITANGIEKTNCNVSYDNGTYTVEYTGDGNSTFFFGVNVGSGNPYAPYLGEKLKYNKNLSFRINCDKLTRSGCYITYFNADGLSILEKNYKTNTEYKIEDVEGAEFFTMRIGFDYGPFTTGDILHFSVQIEYGDTVSDFVAPMSNTENLSYEGVTNVIGEGEITVEYVPAEKNIISVDLPIYNGGVVE